MENLNLKDYIVKLNDRNIQRQRESGFTLYAILAAIVYCFIYLVDNFPILKSILSDLNFFNITILSSNSLLILSFYYLSFGVVTRRKRLTKIFPYGEPLKIEYEDFPIFIAFGTISILNFLFIANSQNDFHRFYLWLFALVSILNILSPFIITLYRLIKEKTLVRRGYSIEKIDFTFFNEKAIRIFSYTFLIYGIILTVISIILFSKIKLNLELNLVVGIIKYSIFYYGLLFLIKTSIEIKSNQNLNNQMEDFEKEIFFENLKDEDIAKRFEHEFSGIPFSKWLNDKHLEIMNFFDTNRKEFLSLDFLIFEVDKIDKNNMPYEFEGRLKEIIIKQMSLLKEANDFVQKIRSNFINLKNFGSLNDQELKDLNYTQTFLNNNIDNFNHLYNNLSRQIVNRQK